MEFLPIFKDDLTDRLVVRFRRKIKIGDYCHEWTATKNRRGYGFFWWPALYTFVPAHRVAFLLANGDIDNTLEVLHTCDNTSCQRPEHLYQGTQVENMKDMYARGRRVASNAPIAANRVYSDSVVADIREAYADGATQQEIADMTGISRGYIALLIANRRRRT